MGYGANMSLTNKTLVPIQTFVTGSNCVYDNGHDGSDLSIFNGATIDAGASLPSSGTQYIEAKRSGSCAFEEASFSLKILTTDGTEIGTTKFKDWRENWTCDNGSSEYLNVYINNTGSQADITITVLAVP